MPSWFGGPEMLVIVLLIVILFGWKKLPDAARSLGRSMRIFKAEVEEMKRDDAPSAAARDTVRGATVVPPASTPGAPAAPTVAAPQAPSESDADRAARLRREAEARIEAEDAERTRIEAEIRARRASERASERSAQHDDPAR